MTEIVVTQSSHRPKCHFHTSKNGTFCLVRRPKRRKSAKLIFTPFFLALHVTLLFSYHKYLYFHRFCKAARRAFLSIPFCERKMCTWIYLIKLLHFRVVFDLKSASERAAAHDKTNHLDSSVTVNRKHRNRAKEKNDSIRCGRHECRSSRRKKNR